MIRFFHILRQKLIKKNKIRTYTYYAIGEIFLVVLGILIALQVNNWNEARKENLERISMLESLKTDFTNTSSRVLNQIEESKLRGKYLLMLLDYSAGNPLKVSEDSLKVMLQQSLMFYFFETFSTTYEQAKSSGKIGLIKNKALLKALSQNEENIKGRASLTIPIFEEHFSDFNSKVEIMKLFASLTDEVKNPTPHPNIYLTGSKLEEFIQSPETYQRLYHLHFINSLASLWWGSINLSVQEVLNQINVSLKD
jgi:hypothetical protein